MSCGSAAQQEYPGKWTKWGKGQGKGQTPCYGWDHRAPAQELPITRTGVQKGTATPADCTGTIRDYARKGKAEGKGDGQ